MMRQVSAERIRQAYRGLGSAKIELFQLSERELAAKEALRRKEADLLMSGAIIGKNAEARAAEIRNGSGIELLEMDLAREAKAKAQLAFDLAVMAVDELKLLIRLEELAARVVE